MTPWRDNGLQSPNCLRRIASSVDWRGGPRFNTYTFVICMEHRIDMWHTVNSHLTYRKLIIECWLVHCLLTMVVTWPEMCCSISKPGVCRSRQMLRICRCGCFGKKVQNLDIYSSWGQNASQLGHPETFENPLAFDLEFPGALAFAPRSWRMRPAARQTSDAADRSSNEEDWKMYHQTLPCAHVPKVGGVHPIAKFQVEVLRTLTKGAKISSDFQAQSCHCHVTIIMLVSTTCHPGRGRATVVEVWGDPRSEWFWVERGGTWIREWWVFPETLAQHVVWTWTILHLISNAWCCVWKQLGWGSLSGQR